MSWLCGNCGYLFEVCGRYCLVVVCLGGTCVDIREVPKAVLAHVTDITTCTKKGEAQYKKVRRFTRFSGSALTSYYKTYDGAPIKWKELPMKQYRRYELLRHITSRKKTARAMEKLEDMEG